MRKSKNCKEKTRKSLETAVALAFIVQALELVIVIPASDLIPLMRMWWAGTIHYAFDWSTSAKLCEVLGIM